MSKEFNNLVTNLKENKEDWDFYPTTNEIIEILYQDLLKYENKDTRDNNITSMLDIGAGTGKVLNRLLELNEIELNKENFKDLDWLEKSRINDFYFKKYAIEKSKILINQMDKDIYIIGTDFFEQSLIDKNINVTFSNPPYSVFEEWSNKILKETNSLYVYLVIPQRWVNSKLINGTVEQRSIEYKILGEFDFLNSEDRKARAKVNLVRFKFKLWCKEKSAFNIWFHTHFKLTAKKEKEAAYKNDEQKRNKINNTLINKENIIEELVNMYQLELQNLLTTHKALEQVDPTLLEKLGVNIDSVTEGLKTHIAGLKNLYWKIAFDRLEAINTRLTKKSKKSLTDELFRQTSIDFTESNIYALIIWTIKNANDYFDSQLLSIYDWLTRKQNVKAYKSNQRFNIDNWRYIYVYKECSHYKLDYRIVTTVGGTFGGDKWNLTNGISTNAYDYIKDLITVAINLGFKIDINELDKIQWTPKTAFKIYDKKGEIFVEMRAYLNGNVHLKFSKEFMKKLNIEAARLKGWIKAPSEAVDEFDLSIEEAKKLFGGNLQLKISNAKLLLECKE